MTLQSFKESLSATHPPQNISDHLKALWYDAFGEWDKSHKVVQDIDDTNACWIHAYLHRKEGDTFNAGYWYNKAGRPKPSSSLDSEWDQIVTALL